MKLFILFLAFFALSQAAPAPEAFSHGLAHLSRQKRDEQVPVKSSSEIDKAAEVALSVDADKLLHQQEEVKKPTEHRHRREAHHEEGHDDATLVAKTLEGHDEEPKPQDSQVKTTGPTSAPKAKREAHHEEGHDDATLVAKTLEEHDEEPKTQDSQVKTTGPTSAPKPKREAHHEEGHDEVKQESKTPQETPVLAAVPAVAPSVAPVTKFKREATAPPPVKPASVIAAEQLAHNPHRNLEGPTPLPELIEPSKQQHKRAAHHEEGHHGDGEKAKKGEDKEEHAEHRHQRDIPVPTEVKTTNAPATTKATDEGSSTSAFPLRHRPKPVAELFHQQEKSATTKPAAAHSSSEESSE
ncbi:nucleolar protein dao-5 [Drosophila tropicalis]|uniref:nucleolar protein dao-5 n=1 Tax=Drosophila tropicalis TaxID=46794 RepID=UPI0035ABB124